MLSLLTATALRCGGFHPPYGLSAGNLLASQLGAKIGLDDAGGSESRALGGTVVGIGKYPLTPVSASSDQR